MYLFVLQYMEPTVEIKPILSFLWPAICILRLEHQSSDSLLPPWPDRNKMGRRAYGVQDYLNMHSLCFQHKTWTKIFSEQCARGRCLQSCARANSHWQMNVAFYVPSTWSNCKQWEAYGFSLSNNDGDDTSNAAALMGPFKKCWCTAQ